MQRICAELKRRGVAMAPRSIGPVVFADSPESANFLAQVRGAFEREQDLAMIGSDWPEVEKASAMERVLRCAQSEEARTWRDAHGPLIYFASGGTTGKRRFAVHSTGTLLAAAQGFVDCFGEGACGTSNVLPLYHIGGFMPLLRALRAHAPWQSCSYRKLYDAAPPREFRSAISLVPTQLHRLLQSPEAVRNLRQFRRIFIGGAGLSEEDASIARAEELPLAPCYGMTETAAMITALEPEAFLRGADGCGRPLPHARVFLAEGRQDTPSAIGIISTSLALGWDTGEAFNRSLFWTNDTGYLDPEGHIVITGRNDRMINTGGETVDPSRVESLLLDLPGVEEAVVIGMPDADWGERVVAFVVGKSLDLEEISATLPETTRPAERPKEFIQLPELPRSEMGKLQRSALEEVWRLRHEGQKGAS